MRSNRKILGAMLVSACAFCWQQAQAGFDQWFIDEIFSSADGSVQFIELGTNVDAQQDLSGQTLSSFDSSGQQQQDFVFSADLSSEFTANQKVLIATTRFEQLTGLEADFLIEPGFVNTEGGSVSFADGVSMVNYSKDQLPKNGFQSIDGSGNVVMASPRNFFDLAVSVSADLFASFDATQMILTVPVLDAPGIGVGNVRFQVDLNALEFTLLNDFYLYQQGIDAGDDAVQFLNGNTLYIPGLLFGEEIYEANLTIVDAASMTFGNPEVISVRAVEPLPDLQLEQSIADGQLRYNQMCANCHGLDGAGFGSFPSLLTDSLPSFDMLRNSIDMTMPLGNAGACVDTADSSCATDVSNYIIHVLR